MPRELSSAARELLTLQSGVISRIQALELGLRADQVRGRLRAGSWQQLHWGVYAAFTGPPPREAQLWAALLRSGTGAVLSHQTAAELHRLTGGTTAIHVTVPYARRVRGATGLILHRSTRISAARHPVLLPPRTRVEETVIDLTQTARTYDEAVDWLCRACGGRFTTPAHLQEALGQRKKARFRGELMAGLAAVADGAHSNLELRYVRAVERPHGLPAARRQAPVMLGRARRYLDNLYEEYGVAVELDGQIAHRAEDRWRDRHRDNALCGAGIIALHYSWGDVTRRGCEVAAEIATILRGHGWPGAPRPCGRGCPVRHRQP